MSGVAGAVIGVGIFLVVAREIYRSIHFLKEKEVKIIERLGRYHKTLTPVRQSEAPSSVCSSKKHIHTHTHTNTGCSFCDAVY